MLRRSRARLDGGRLEERVDVASEVFVSEGFSAASTNEIARRANSSKTTFYSRLPTTEQLFLAVIERRKTGICRPVAAALPEERPTDDTLRNFGAAVIGLALSTEHAALARVL